MVAFQNQTSQNVAVAFGLPSPLTIPAGGLLSAPGAVAVNYLLDTFHWSLSGAAWSATATYNPLNAVIGSNGTFYQATTVSHGIDPTTDTSGAWRALPAAYSPLNTGRLKIRGGGCCTQAHNLDLCRVLGFTVRRCVYS